MLGQAEYEAFLKSYDEDKYQGLRFNIGKGKQEDFLALAEEAFSLEKIPWAEHGFYYGAEAAPGKHAYHEAGVYLYRSRVLWHRRLICKPDRVSECWIFAQRPVVRQRRSRHRCEGKDCS